MRYNLKSESARGSLLLVFELSLSSLSLNNSSFIKPIINIILFLKYLTLNGFFAFGSRGETDKIKYFVKKRTGFKIELRPKRIMCNR